MNNNARDNYIEKDFDLENHVHHYRVIRWYADSSAQRCICGARKLVYTNGTVHEGHLL